MMMMQVMKFGSELRGQSVWVGKNHDGGGLGFCGSGERRGLPGLLPAEKVEEQKRRQLLVLGGATQFARGSQQLPGQLKTALA